MQARPLSKFGWLSLCIILMLSVSPALATVHDVAIDNFFFAPANTNVYPGDTVRWTLVAGVHTTTSDVSSPKFWDSGLMGTPGMTFIVIFTPADPPGPYPYHCTPHASFMKDTIWVLPPPVNGMMNGAATAPQEQLNPEVAWSETNFDEAYSVWTEFGGSGYFPSVTGVGISLSASLGTWNQAYVSNAVYPDSWSPSISSNVVGGYLMAHTEFVFPAYTGSGGIVMHASPGGGPGFLSPSPVIGNVPGVNWFDYPVVDMDEDPASPPAALGTGHLVFNEFIDIDGDPNLDGNFFNDPADIVNYLYTFTNMNAALTPPFLYPAFAPVALITGGLPVFSPSMSTHRAAIDAVTTSGPTPAVGPGGLYFVYPDYATSIIMIMASPAPGVPFAALGGPVAVAPMAPLPPVAAAGTMYGTTVDVTIDDGPNCPGNVYVVWSDMGFGIDADIFFSSSTDGGFTWSPLIKVNQDVFAGGPVDQWAPRIDVDKNTGDIYVTYYDRRNDPAANTKQETWVSISSDCGLTWRDCKVSDAGPTGPLTSITWPHAPAGRYIGDYLGMDYNPLNGPSFVWNDARNGSDQDVFFAQKYNCGCCVLRGDFDHNGSVDISDLTAYVDWLFGGGPGPVCPEEADIDGNGTADISDITYFVDYLFGGGPAPAPC